MINRSINPDFRHAVAIIASAVLFSVTSAAVAQPLRDRSPNQGGVELDLAGELELGILIDLISDRLGINIVSSSSAELD